MKTIHTASDDAAILACREVILSLRPHLLHTDIVAQVKEMQRENYHIIYLKADDHPSKVVAFAGFRYMQKLHSGKHIYIDDLATLPEYQGRGYASLLLRYIRSLAQTAGFHSVQLDSGHLLHPAHKVYHKEGYFISAHHFSQPL
ncbi:GNAT family N-acetyltransferase [Chitinophaga niabensis]|uniref:Ribosomal protein S18 acetylase RimI n=1 Tax=Chitinophaga niabensis TaxID=536979 RepID=A0A1N6DBA3_9BACT|nr:GNAT family N-acetyltransferase [Chitinophaga niabensis]SIN67973.1 Ribosomal protein S18 acetylase RimI [Chitinophaga niabensis]